jgi:hypothetical protein
VTLDTGPGLLAEWSSESGIARLHDKARPGAEVDDFSILMARSLVIMFLAFVLVLIALMIRMIANDARRRGKSPVLVVLLCLLSFPLGWIAWLIFRPEPLPRRRQPFRLEDRRVQ